MSGTPQQSNLKKFVVLSVFLPVTLFVVAEGAARLLWPAENSGGYKVFKLESGELQVRPEYQGAFHPLSFPAKKFPGRQRILCLGGSSTYGFPFGMETAFSSWLQIILEHEHPELNWEILNLGAMSYGSQRIRDLTPEFLRLQPDAVILYSGHNEFVELAHTRPAVKERGFSRLRLIELVQRMTVAPESESPAEVYRETVHLRTDDERRQAVAQFESNYREILDLCLTAQVPILVSTMPSSLSDWRPDGSRNFGGEPQGDWTERLVKARELVSSGNFKEALDLLNQLSQTAPGFAEIQYLSGQCKLSLGDYPGALASFVSARDLDASPQRAISSINDAIVRVAKDCDVPLIDAVKIFAERSKHGITGKLLIEDYVHPTLLGHQILALEFYLALADQVELDVRPRSELDAFLTSLPKPESTGRARASFFYNLGLKFINQKNWAKVIETNEQAVNADPNHALAYNNLGRGYLELGDSETALKHFERAAELRPDIAGVHRNLAGLYQQLGKLAEAESSARDVLKLRTKDASAHYLLGTLLAVQEKTDEAIRHYRYAIRYDPEYFEAHANLGLAYAHAGQNEQAKKCWESALRIKPGEPVVSGWLNSLK